MRLDSARHRPDRRISKAHDWCGGRGTRGAGGGGVRVIAVPYSDSLLLVLLPSCAII